MFQTYQIDSGAVMVEYKSPETMKRWSGTISTAIVVQIRFWLTEESNG